MRLCNKRAPEMAIERAAHGPTLPEPVANGANLAAKCTFCPNFLHRTAARNLSSTTLVVKSVLPSRMSESSRTDFQEALLADRQHRCVE
jgi:hypothetical protein